MGLFGFIREGNKIRIGIFLPQEERLFPFSELFSTKEELIRGIHFIHEQLDLLLEEAKKIFDYKSKQLQELTPEMNGEEIWKFLSNIEDEQEFINKFNALGEIKRREVADFVFTRCNIFAGRASLFSLRYNNDSALLPPRQCNTNNALYSTPSE